jgi:hypothetical protein
MIRQRDPQDTWNERRWDTDEDGSSSAGTALARGLGWFSMGLGLLETLAPEQVARWLGVERHAQFVRACGMREIANGAAILRQPDRAQWLWARTAGDVMDLAALMSAMNRTNPRRSRVRMSTALVAGIAVLDLVCGVQLARRGAPVV